MTVDIDKLLEMAAWHAARTKADIELSSTREEHIRVTARANEAEVIADGLRNLITARNHERIGDIINELRDAGLEY